MSGISPVYSDSGRFEKTDHLDRNLLKGSSAFMEPFCYASELYTRCTSQLVANEWDYMATKTQEAAFRSLVAVCGLGALASIYANPLAVLGGVLAWGTTGKLLKVIGYSVQKDGFTHVRGNAPEKSFENGKVKVLSWNILGPSGGYNYTNGGASHFRSRIDEIIKKVLEKDPDVIVFNEIYDTALEEMIIDRLKNHYAHFFTQLGADVALGNRGGVMVITKGAPYSFQREAFSTNDWKLNRGFATLQLKQSPNDDKPFFRIIGTHLIHSPVASAKATNKQQVKEAQKMRFTQNEQVKDSIARSKFSLPTVYCGDMNLELGSDEEATWFAKHLNHTYTGPESTCTNKFSAKWKDINNTEAEDEGIIDYNSVFKAVTTDGNVIEKVSDNIQFKPAVLLKAYNEETMNTKEILSDHHGLVTEYTITEDPKA